MALSELIVIDVVPRRDFESPGAEFAIDILVADDRNLTARSKGDASKAADVPGVSGTNVESIHKQQWQRVESTEFKTIGV